MDRESLFKRVDGRWMGPLSVPVLFLDLVSTSSIMRGVAANPVAHKIRFSIASVDDASCAKRCLVSNAWGKLARNLVDRRILVG